jgi:hypothetical protein
MLKGLWDFLTSSAQRRWEQREKNVGNMHMSHTFIAAAAADAWEIFRKRHWHVVKYFLVLLPFPPRFVYKKSHFSHLASNLEREGIETHYAINNKLYFTAGAFAFGSAWLGSNPLSRATTLKTEKRNKTKKGRKLGMSGWFNQTDNEKRQKKKRRENV